MRYLYSVDNFRFISLILLWMIVSMMSKISVTYGGNPPEVSLISVDRIYHNGEHNAFTDLCFFNNQYFLTFRSCPDGHGINPTSSIIILSSKDGKSWEQVFRFSVPQRDTRDPHFLIFQNKLFVYTGTWFCGEGSSPETYDINQHLGYAVWTEDGRSWQEPQLLEGTYGHYVWRAATYNGKAYLCARRKHKFVELPSQSGADKIMESAMLESDDGLIWKKVALFQEEDGDETAFLFEDDGTVLGMGRRGTGHAELVRAKPPYKEWQRLDLGLYIGGPLLARWENNYLVGGRKKEQDAYQTTLYWLIDDKLHQFAQLPSGGDNSYPGFVELDDKMALISYYSSHEKDDAGKEITAIYLAKFRIED